MTHSFRAVSLPAVTLLLALAGGTASFAQDAMAPATDAMMAPMSDDDLKKCMDQAAMITFPDVMMMAQAGCTAMKDGKIHDMMTSMGMAPMGGDAMAPMAGDAMAPAPDAMAPAADAMAPAK